MRGRRAFFGGALLAALCFAAGCSDGAAEDGKTVLAEGSAVGEMTEESTVASESEKNEKTVSFTSAGTTARTSETSESAEEKITLWRAPNGEAFEIDSDRDTSLGVVFDKALYRPSTGTFYEPSADPGLFDENGMFLGEPIMFDESDFRCVRSGDKINGYTVERAETTFYPDAKNEAFYDENGLLPHVMSIRFGNDVTLTGYLLYCAYDDPTLIFDGDFFMIPDASFRGFPCLNFFYWFRREGRIEAFPQEDLREPWIVSYNDSYVIHLGNFYRDYAEREDLSALIGDRSQSRAWRTAVTIKELSVSAGSVLSYEFCGGRIVRVGEPGK